MRPCGCKRGNVCMCVEGNAKRGHKKYTRKCMHQMNAPNSTAKGTSPLQHPYRNAAQSACTGIHPPPRPPSMQSVHRCKSKKSAGAEPPPLPPPRPRPLLGPGGREAGLQQGEGARALGREGPPRRRPLSPSPTLRMRRFRRASAANTRSPTAESSMLTRRFPARPLPGAEKQQPALDSP